MFALSSDKWNKRKTQRWIRKTAKKSFSMMNFARLTLRIENDLSSRLFSCSVVVLLFAPKIILYMV